MAIKYLDGKRLYRVLHAGLQRVLAREDYLNKINVFPVPDSDTGTNMAYTLTAIQDGIEEKAHPEVNEMSQHIADSALDGARGNSGVILAQFLVGFSEAIPDKITITTKQFAKAVENACDYAYDALVEPREGTILTVIREWSDHIKDKAEHLHDFQELLDDGLTRARKSLKDTPKKLEVLRKAGVVDAGAQGFVYLLEGMQDFITNGKIKLYKKSAARKADKTPDVVAEYNEKYQYCTECTVTNDDSVDKQKLKSALALMGDSIVLAGTDQKIKVHIHTDKPQSVFDICSAAGDVSGQKADDMLQQQKDAHEAHEDIAIVMDSACDLPDELLEKHNIHIVPVKLGFGSEMIVDRVGMTPEEFWIKVANSEHHPKTSQPSPGDFRRKYQLLLNSYKSILSIHIPAGSSGTYQSAVTASKALKDTRIDVIDSMNLSLAAGFVVLSAAEAVEAGKSIDEVLKIVEKAKENTKVYVGIQSMEFTVRGGRVPPAVKKVADLLRLNPVLSVSEKGQVRPVGKTFGARDIPGKLYKWVMKRLDEKKKYRFGVIYTTDRYDAEMIAASLRAKAGEENVHVTQVGPALGVHAGPGAIGIVTQELEN